MNAEFGSSAAVHILGIGGSLGWAEMNPLLIYPAQPSPAQPSPAQPSPAQLDQDGSLNVIWQKVHFCGEVRCGAGRHSTLASEQISAVRRCVQISR